MRVNLYKNIRNHEYGQRFSFHSAVHTQFNNHKDIQILIQPGTPEIFWNGSAVKFYLKPRTLSYEEFLMGKRITCCMLYECNMTRSKIGSTTVNVRDGEISLIFEANLVQYDFCGQLLARLMNGTGPEEFLMTNLTSYYYEDDYDIKMYTVCVSIPLHCLKFVK